MTPEQLELAARQISIDRDLIYGGRVGAGAFKETYRVAAASGAISALKIYRPGFPAERPQREINAMERCDHPNIAKLIAVARYNWAGITLLYCLEEFIPGGTLTQRISAGLLRPDVTWVLGTQLIDAVGHIAGQGLVHRDLKPDNIMFRADGITPVIVDFGIVRDLTNSSLTPSWLVTGPGTPFFSSPEQLRNDKALIDWRSDQFSLGVVLSLVCLGVHPYAEAGCTDVEVVQRVADRGPQSDRFRAAALQAGLSLLIPMTAAWPIERLRTPVQLADQWRCQGGR